MDVERSSLFPFLRRDIDRMLCAFGLSHDGAKQTLPSDNHEGGHDEESDQAPQRELHDGDAEQRDEAPVPVLRPEKRDEQGGRRVLPLDSVPLVRLAHGAEGDVASLGWHVISGEDLLGALRRVQEGEDADLLYAELWANADHETGE